MKKYIIILIFLSLFSCTTPDKNNCNCTASSITWSKYINDIGMPLVSDPIFLKSYDTLVPCGTNSIKIDTIRITYNAISYKEIYTQTVVQCVEPITYD